VVVTKAVAGYLIYTDHTDMKKVIQFGEDVPGYDIPVLNEREIRAAAGILFLVIYTALMLGVSLSETRSRNTLAPNKKDLPGSSA